VNFDLFKISYNFYTNKLNIIPSKELLEELSKEEFEYIIEENSSNPNLIKISNELMEKLNEKRKGE
jgi:hypothetical protein